MDNSKTHTSDYLRTFCQNRGWVVITTPPHTPWFNPIETLFRLVKSRIGRHSCPEL